MSKTKQKDEQLTAAELRGLIKATGLKQAEVARRLGRSPVTISRWLAGTQEIGAPDELRLALQYLAMEQQMQSLANQISLLGGQLRALGFQPQTKQRKKG